MSTKDARNEARLINIAMAYLSGTPDKRERLTVERHLVRQALCFVRDKAEQALRELEPPTRQVALKASVLKAREDQRRSDEQARQAHTAWRQSRFKEMKAKAAATRKRTSQFTAIGREVVCIFETIKVGGKAIGDLWHSELEHLRNKGAFEAALLQAILHHCQPAKDMKVRDLVTPEKLAQFVADANRAVNRVKAAA